MAHDPFAPPQASLEVDDDRDPVPRRVAAAVMAVIAGAVTAFALKAGTAFGAGGTSTPVELVPALIPLLALGLLAWKIFAGHDWARWILAAFLGLTAMWWVYYLSAAGFVPMPRSLVAASVIQFALNLVACVLLFTGEARKWFRS